jgi:hypothetical protein
MYLATLSFGKKSTPNSTENTEDSTGNTKNGQSELSLDRTSLDQQVAAGLSEWEWTVKEILKSHGQPSRITRFKEHPLTLWLLRVLVFGIVFGYIFLTLK